MGSEPPVQQKRPGACTRLLLLRGESAVASAGIMLAAILLGTMAASSWWAMRGERGLVEAGRIEQVRAVGTLLARAAEAMLAHDELSAARRLVAEARRDYDLARCRVVLSDGTVIASSEPAEITAQKLPATWTRTRLLDERPDARTPSKGTFTASFPLAVPGRGSADLEVAAGVTRPPGTAKWEIQTGLGAIGAVAMLALLLVYRRMRSRLSALGAIREALLAIGAGETAASTLAVSAELGVEARAWNDVIAARERLRKQDVADRARGALAGRGVEARGDLAAACDAMSQGLLLVDDRNLIGYANGAAAAFLTAKRDDLIGADVAKFLQVENVLETIRAVAGGSVRRRTVIDVERKDDAAPGGPSGAPPGGPGGVLRFSVRPVRRDDCASAMVIIEDVTQQRVAERARSAFVAHTTHELRTPLTNIRLYVETAIDEGEADPVTRARCLNVINGETRRLERIVGEMLSMSEIEAGSFKLHRDDVRLDTVFDELRDDYAPQAAEKSITLAMNLPPKLPAIKGDRDKMMLALHNLLGNALKYTPEGGTVTVAVELDADRLAVAVSDTGIGIAPDDAEKIFDRFYRAKDPRVSKITGTGLGLTLAREVVRLHGGDISVESQINQGSTFTMTLPVRAEAA